MKRIVYAAGLAVLVSFSGLVHAQGEQQVIEEVIVTAQKRTESLQDVPLTVVAIENDALRRMGVSDLRDVSSLGSNVTITNDKNGIQIAIRGVTNNEGVPPSTAFHTDGIYSGIPQTGMVAFLDVERVEILKGPQGTIYGRNSTAGAVNVISKRPNLTEMEGRVDVIAGDYNQLRTEGAINVPIVPDQLAVRFSGLYEDRDGFNEHDGFGVPSEDSDNRDNQAFKARMLYEPTDRVSWLLGAETASQEGPGPRLLLDFDHLIPLQEQIQRRISAGDRNQFLLGLLSPHTHFNLLPQDTKDRIKSDVRFNPISPVNTYFFTFAGRLPPFDPLALVRSGAALQGENVRPLEDWAADSDLTSDAYLSDLTIDFDAIELNFLAGYRESDDLYGGSGGWWGFPIIVDFDSKDKEQSYELRASGGESLYWQAGIYHYEQEAVENAGITGGLTSVNEKSLGVFGTSTLELSDALRLTAGIRYSEDEIDGSLKDLRTENPRPTDERAVDFQNWSGRLSVDYDLSADSMLYAKISSGYKTGGLNFRNEQNPTYGEETVISYEIGSKNILLDGALQLNGSVFYNDYTDLQNDQLFAQLPLDGSGNPIPNPEIPGTFVVNTFDAIENVSDVDMYGAEVEWIWQATPGLRVDGALALLETEIKEGRVIDESLSAFPIQITETDGSTSTRLVDHDVSGNKMRKAPDASFRLGIEYTQRFSWGDLVPRLDFYWEDDVYHDPINRPQDIQEAWTRTDVGITYHSNDDKLLVQLWARNLEDDDIRANIRQTSIGAISILMPPRTYGVRVGYQF